MRILFALPGLHRIDRGAEVAFMKIASGMARRGEEVTLMGSGPERADTAYRFVSVPSIDRYRFRGFPHLPTLRDETAYEDLSFALMLMAYYRPGDFDVTVTCNYPYTNWALRRPVLGERRPPHVFVTQNGDWPAIAKSSEYRFFGCEGLVCVNPDYFERNRERWNCCLIPNGVDTGRFTPGPECRARFGLPSNKPVILMVSAFIDSKRIPVGVKAIASLPDAHLVVAGDGPLREAVEADANSQLPGRFTRLKLTPDQMPDLYRSADVFLHLSREESSALAFAEALATGLPIVGHDSNRLRWILGDDAYLVDTNDDAELRHALEKALQEGPIAETRRTERAKEFDWRTIAAQYQAFLQSVVGR